MTTVITRTLFLILVAFCLALCVFAQQPQQTDAPAGFNKIEQMVPMRDGVKLHTIIFAPKNQSGPLPIIFNRTPYGIDGIYRAFPGSLAELIDEGFIFAFQDIRGKFKSEGQFVMLRNPRGPGNKTEIDEGTTPTTRSIGCSKMCQTITAASAWRAPHMAPGWS